MMVESGRPYEEIAISDHLAYRTQPAAFTAEDATDVLIDPNHGDAAQEIIEGLLIPVWISGIVNALVEFCEGMTESASPCS
jgi:hypothetical protein